jgi:hypothetical protein
MKREPCPWPAVLLVVVGLGACAGGPPPSTVSEARNAAVGYALTQRTFAVALAQQCRTDPITRRDLSKPAQQAMQAWEERNRARLSAVSRYFEDYLAVVARREGRRKAVERRAELTRRYTQGGNATAQRAIEQAGGRESCPELLQGLARGDLDIVSAEFDPVLDGLVENYAPQK